MALPGDSGHGLSSDRRVCRVAYVSRRLRFFFFFAKSFLYVLLLKPRSSREIWGMVLPDLSAVTRVECRFLSCVRRACVAAFDAPVTIIVVAG